MYTPVSLFAQDWPILLWGWFNNIVPFNKYFISYGTIANVKWPRLTYSSVSEWLGPKLNDYGSSEYQTCSVFEPPLYVEAFIQNKIKDFLDCPDTKLVHTFWWAQKVRPKTSRWVFPSNANFFSLNFFFLKRRFCVTRFTSSTLEIGPNFTYPVSTGLETGLAVPHLIKLRRR